MAGSRREDLLRIAWEYVGGGYFRKKGVPKGDVAPLIHAPKLVAALVAQIKDTTKQQKE